MFSRGDFNLLNRLRDGDSSACVDFQHSGHRSDFFDAADLIEHISAREIPDSTLFALMPGLGITPANQHQLLSALPWLAALWNQRYTRADEFGALYARVQLLQRPETPWYG
ncbi:hypothetical protein [Nocardiopsis synnemataformans]|uniref:hypothetical protein n=1 Tax=Nocardiopsis synnemataformans TaxID=61305 RepID=UPI003EBC432E